MEALDWTRMTQACEGWPWHVHAGDLDMAIEQGLGPKAEATRARIAEAACKLFVANGIGETTTRDIAAEAGVSEGSIYRYYESKDTLALGLFRDLHERLADAVEKAAAAHPRLEDKVRAVIHTYCTMADAEWTLFGYHLIAQHQLLRKLPKGTRSPVAVAGAIVARAVAEGEIADRRPAVLVNAILGLVLQPAVAKVYGHPIGRLRDHADWLAEAAVRVVKG